MSDGKIIIDTSIDSSGAEKDIKSLTSKLGSIAGTATKTLAKVSAVMATAAAGAIGVLTKLSVEQYAEYEQLTGGVETLFKNSSDKVMEYANNAYESAGMSANEYMSTITGFAASLLQGLGGDTEKAAQIGNMAVTDMSDNANKMGTAIERIQDAYQGFAKQNYTMLDNLKLGYGGTKTEMERLLADAQKISGVKYDISNFNDVIEAIHVIQEQMGITGTTSLEAASTIEGSLNMTKSAWTNLLTGMADDNANFDVLVQNLVNSLGSLGENLLPRIKIAIEGIGELIRTLLPKVLDEIPEMMASLFPESMQEDIKTIFEGIVEAIKTTVDFAMQWIPKITEGFAWFLENSSTIVGGILAISAAVAGFKAGAMMTKVIKSWQEAQLALALYGMSAEGAAIKQGVLNGVFSIWETLVALFTGKITLATAATALWSKAQAVLNSILTANPIGLVVAGIAALVAGIIYLWNTNEGFREAVINCWNAIKEAGIDVWNWLVKFFTEDIPKAWDSVVTFFKGIPDWFKEIWGKITDTCKEWGNDISNFFSELWNKIITAIKEWGRNISSFFIELWNGVLDTIKQWGENIKNFFTETIPSVIQSVIGWFNELPYKIGYALGELLGSIVNGWIKIFKYFAENIPIWIDNIVTWFSELPERIWTVLTKVYNFIIQTFKNIGSKFLEFKAEIIQTITEFLTASYQNITKWSTDTWNKAVETGTNFLNSIIEFFSQLPGVIWNWLVNAFNNVANWVGNMINKANEVGTNFINSIINFFSQLPGKVWSWLSNTISKVSEFASNLGNKAKEAGQGMVSNIVSAVSGLPSQMASIGRNIVEGVWNGITGMGSWLMNKVSSFFSGIVDGAKAALGIHSPSRVMRDQVGKYMAQGVGVGFEDETKNVQKSIEGDFEYLVAKMQATVDYETTMTTARVTANNGLSSKVEESNSTPKDNKPNNPVAIFNIDGREFMRATAPYQDEYDDYYNGR